MQGLADGYFILPYTIGGYLADEPRDEEIDTNHPAFEKTEKEVKEKIQNLLQIQGDLPTDYFHKELGKILWDNCGMSRNAKGLKTAQAKIKNLRTRFWKELQVAGVSEDLNKELEKAGRVADYLEFAQTMVLDALNRNESCGGHFREEYQTKANEALRNDKAYSYVAAWEFKGVDKPPTLHKENLDFENVKLTQRSYK